MNIQKFSNTPNFKGAIININALSDTHGHIERADLCFQTMMNNDLFEHEKRGSENFLITGGDWFIAGEKKGYKSNPNKPLMYFQLDIYNKFIEEIKKKFPNLKSLFVIGNHELDAEEKTIHDTFSKLDSQIIATNLDFDNSSAFKDLKDEDKIVKLRVDYIKDDKDETKFHPVLNIGISPINMAFYQGYQEGINFIENAKTSSNFDTSKTFSEVQKAVKAFKERYPRGVVILTSHTGVGFASKCAQMGNIDLIFDAHEHKDETNFVNNTPIVSLSMDFQKLANAKIKLDDDGKIKELKIKSYNPLTEENNKKGEITKFYKKIFKDDFKKIYSIKSSDSNLKRLGVEGIRYKNSNLSNFVTDCILSELQKTNPDVDIFALNTSSIRGGFELNEGKNVSNIEVINCLDGLKHSQAEIYKTKINGRTLAMLVLDNILFNSVNPQRHSLIQYSGIKIDVTSMFRNCIKGDTNELCNFITLEKEDKPIEPYRFYTIANPEKYFIKTTKTNIKNLFEISTPTGQNAVDLFIKYFENNPNSTIEPKVRIY